MKKSELITIIKLAVREELKTTLPSLLSEVGSVGSTSRSVKIENTELMVKPKKSSSKVFSRNEKINEALQATAGGVPQEGSLVSNGYNNPNTQVDFNGNELSIEELPEDISNALTRDYSSLLSAIDKKKANK